MSDPKAMCLQSLMEARDQLDSLMANLESGELELNEVAAAMNYGEVLYDLCQAWHFGACKNEQEVQELINRLEPASTHIPALWGWRGDFMICQSS